MWYLNTLRSSKKMWTRERSDFLNEVPRGTSFTILLALLGKSAKERAEEYLVRAQAGGHVQDAPPGSSRCGLSSGD